MMQIGDWRVLIAKVQRVIPQVLPLGVESWTGNVRVPAAHIPFTIFNITAKSSM
jgi:hypothetical protein